MKNGTKNNEEGLMIAERAETRSLHQRIKESLKKEEAKII
jgi:hypothetical protein